MALNQDELQLLRALWDQKNPVLSTNEIAQRFRCSKNSIVGYAHRMKLDGRPSPIKRFADGDAPKSSSQEIPQPPKTTLPKLASVVNAEIATIIETIFDSNVVVEAPLLPQSPQPTSSPAPLPDLIESPALAPEAKPAVVAPLSTIRRFSNLLCCWPIGEPGRKDFRICDEPTEGHPTYCQEHQNRAYVKKVRTRLPVDEYAR